MSGSTDRPITIRSLQIGNDWPGQRVGGLNRYFSEILRHLPRAGVQVRGLVVGPESIYQETEGLVKPFARSDDPMYKRLYCARREILNEIGSGNIDLLVSHFALYTPPLGLWTKRVPLTVHFHGPWAAESGVEHPTSRRQWIKHTLERSVYRRAKRIITLSRSFQSELVSNYGIDEKITRVVPGGIDLDRFNIRLRRLDARHRLQWPPDRPIVLAVRRMVRRMGLENLVDAMRTVVAVQPDVLLVLGGKGPLSSELQQRVVDYGLEGNIRFLGRIPEEDLAVAYRAADMTVVPSVSLEGFGMITLESLACGTPALVTPVGGLPEIMLPFAPQCVFANTSTAEMAGVLSDVLTGKITLPNEQSCREYAERFSWQNISEELSRVYEEALGP